MKIHQATAQDLEALRKRLHQFTLLPEVLPATELRPGPEVRSALAAVWPQVKFRRRGDALSAYTPHGLAQLRRSQIGREVWLVQSRPVARDQDVDDRTMQSRAGWHGPQGYAFEPAVAVVAQRLVEEIATPWATVADRLMRRPVR